MSSLISSARRQGASAADAPAAVRQRPDGAVEIAEVWLILWHRRLMILAVSAALMAATIAYGLLTPSLYTASSQILVDPRDRIVVSNDVNPSTLPPDGGVAQVESQSSVLRSTGVLVRAIRATRLTEDREFAGGGLKALFNAMGLSALLDLFERKKSAPADGLSPAENNALESLRGKMAVKRADKTLVLEVIVTTRGAEKSANIANAIADAYLVDQAEARSRSAREASSAITARLAEQRRRVEEAENAVERYRVENNLVTASGRPITDQQLGEISTQYAATQARIAALRAQVDQLARRRDGVLEGTSTEASQSNVITKLREQEATLIQREADLQTQLGPLHPSIQAARNQLTNTRQLIATEIRRVEQTIRTELDRALGNERQLASRLEALTRLNQGSDQASVRLRDLQRDLEAARSVYANFLLRAQETREQAALDTTNARIISRALPPAKASWPPLPALIAGAGFIGLGLGAGFALVREYAAPHFLSATQAENALGVPVVGVLARAVPRAKAGEPAKADEQRNSDLDVASLALLNLFGRTSGKWRSPTSVILVAAERDAENRRRAARLLAEAAADRGESVLFVDAASSQSGGRPGLLDVLRGECRFDAAVDFGRVEDIGLMQKGRPQGAQRGGSRTAAERFLADAGRDFDMIVVDAGDLARTVALGSLMGAADHVLLVAEINGTRQREASALAETAAIMGGAVTAALLVESRGRA